MFKLVLFFTAFSLTTARHTNFYRNDYTFIAEYDANYKIHWDINGVSFNLAFIACENEGAQLFYPKEANEWKIVKILTAHLLEAANTTDVIVGIHDEIGQGMFATVDGSITPIPILEDQTIHEGQNCIIMDMETGKYRPESCVTEPETKRIFVCKKVDEKPCGTIDLGYKYSEEAKKCYKLNKHEVSWLEAWQTCIMEGGLLVSPESDSEAEIVTRFLPNCIDTDYFSGFRRIFHGSDFYTVKGQQLEDAGFQRWNRGEKYGNDNHDCGVIFLYENNRLHIRTRDCNARLPFVCEMPARA